MHLFSFSHLLVVLEPLETMIRLLLFPDLAKLSSRKLSILYFTSDNACLLRENVPVKKRQFLALNMQNAFEEIPG
jgi:hypothetical protein